MGPVTLMAPLFPIRRVKTLKMMLAARINWHEIDPPNHWWQFKQHRVDYRLLLLI